MQSPMTSDPSDAATPPAPTGKEITEPDFSGTPQPIEVFSNRPNFPHCALGAYVDISGFAGVVVEIVKDSIKVRSPEGLTQRFNANRLKTLHAPPDRSEPAPMMRAGDSPKPAAPPRVYIAEPDFTAPVRSINDYAARPDFPQCVYGKHVDIAGYVGVVVEIVNGSLKIQSQAGSTRGSP